MNKCGEREGLLIERSRRNMWPFDTDIPGKGGKEADHKTSRSSSALDLEFRDLVERKS